MSMSLKTISVDKGLDTIINEGISVFRRFGKENSAINATDFYARTLTRHPDGVT